MIKKFSRYDRIANIYENNNSCYVILCYVSINSLNYEKINLKLELK